MTAPRKICAVTGSRADYGLLLWVLRGIIAAPQFQLQLAVTGMHLASQYGNTWQVIEADGFVIDAKVDIELAGDAPKDIAKSIGLGVTGFGEAFERLAPDLLLILGDRYEILAAAQAAVIANIPIAHIAGGDATEGAVDEVIRHSLTKMAHLHFTTSEPARRRVIQMGEAPARVFNTGSPGLDTLLRTPLLGRVELEQSLGITLLARNFLITFHPATLDGEGAAAAQFDALLAALEQYADGRTRFIFTRPNSDAGSAAITARLDAWLAGRTDAVAYASLGQLRYLSLIAQIDAVIGNSSSGLYEAPSLHKPTVNIGSRQQGRAAAASVITCAPDAGAISAAIGQALALDCSKVLNPYGDGHAAERIVAHLRDMPDFHALLHKQFHELPAWETQ